MRRKKKKNTIFGDILTVGKKGVHTYKNNFLDFLFYRQQGIQDQVSKNDLTDNSAGAAYYIHPTTGELVTVVAGEVLDHPVLGITSLPAYEQLCQDSENPGAWVPGGATRVATGEVFGSFTEYNIIDAESSASRVFNWKSVDSGNPVGTLYCSIRYRAGTSGSIHVRLYDETARAGSSYKGAIGDASISVDLAGTLSIISDEYDLNLGYYILTFSMLFNNLSNNLTIGIGPNSSDNSSIKVLGADVSEDRAILDFHVPSSGSNVSIASRAGTTKAAGLAANFPKLFNALDGVADGVELVTTNANFTEWDDDNPIDYNVENDDVNNYITTHDNGARIVSDDSAPLTIYRNFPVTPLKKYEYKILKSNQISGDVRLYIYDRTNSAPILSFLNMGWGSNGFHSYRFIAPSGCESVGIYIYRDNDGNTDYVLNLWSLQQISTAQFKMSGTWTPGQDYSDWAAVKSILTGSDADHLLQVNSTGGVVLDDGTATATVDIDFTAGTEYEFEVIAGRSSYLAADKMQLNVKVNGVWQSAIADYDGSFNSGTDMTFGLSNAYQTSIKNLKVEKLKQAHWRS